VRDQVSHPYLPTGSIQCNILVLRKWKWKLYRENCLVKRHYLCHYCT
jgi:hypothetical protein